MEVNFLNQKPCIPPWPGVFQFVIFFSVVLGKTMCIYAFVPSSRPSSSFVILFIHSAFSLYFLFVAIFLSQIVGFLLHPFVGMFSCHLLPSVDKIFFRCFGISCFVCIVFPFVDVSLAFLCSPLFPGFKLYFYFFWCCLFLFVTTYSDVFPSFYHFGLFS